MSKDKAVKIYLVLTFSCNTKNNKNNKFPSSEFMLFRKDKFVNRE